MSAEPRRIALVLDYSLDYLGGAQSAFVDEARLLAERGHSVTVVAPGQTRPAVLAPAVHWLPIAAAGTVPGVDLPVVRNTPRLRDRLHQAFVEAGVEVVHTHSEFGLSAAAISVARRLGLRTAQTVHTFFWQAAMPGPFGPVAAAGIRTFGRWLRGFPSATSRLADAPLDSALRGLTFGMGRLVDVVISPSAHQAARLRQAGLRRVDVVPNALASAGDPGEPLTAVDAPLRLVWVGRMVAEKRILEWVDAVRKASVRLPAGSLEVEVVGEGPLRAEAEKRAGRAPITFLGRLGRDEVQERMRAAHLVVLTSHGFDNQPVTIVEALHARRGVFYVDPALTEGVDVAGIRASGPDVPAMARLLVELVRDPARVVAASAQAAEGAREFDPDVHVQRVLAAYAPEA